MDDNEASSALSEVLQVLSRLDADSRLRVLAAVVGFFGHQLADQSTQRPSTPGATKSGSDRPLFSADTAPSPKQFLVQKQPKTDVERVAVLAYYLTHYRDLPHFKTVDLAALNTEAAQPKFSNTAYASTNASNAGYLASASGGLRQLSAAGEQFVIAMPDREAAKNIMSAVRSRKANKKRKR